MPEIVKMIGGRPKHHADFRDGSQAAHNVVRIETLTRALHRALETIQAMHGPIGWPQYQHSPEMVQIKNALREPCAAVALPEDA